MANILDRHLVQHFKDQAAFTKSELRSFYASFEPDLKESTLKWRIYDLKKTRVIREIKRGLYTTQILPIYEPPISTKTQKLLKTMEKMFDGVEFCGWETSWLNAFSRHQASQSIIILEIERDLMESLFYHLKDEFSYSFYINPSKEEIKYQVAEQRLPVVIKKLVTRSPIKSIPYKNSTYRIPTIEKMLVDLVCDEDLIYAYQGTELVYIWKKVLEHYDFDFSQMLTYAKRREKEKQIRNLLVHQMPHLVKDVLDVD